MQSPSTVWRTRNSVRLGYITLQDVDSARTLTHNVVCVLQFQKLSSEIAIPCIETETLYDQSISTLPTHHFGLVILRIQQSLL